MTFNLLVDKICIIVEGLQKKVVKMQGVKQQSDDPIGCGREVFTRSDAIRVQ